MMDQKLKQRLVGAIVLISLAVIFIPVILEGPDDEWTPRVQEIPVPPQIEYQADVELPVPAESSREMPVPVEPPAPEVAVESTSAPAKQEPAPSVTATQAAPEKPAKQTAKNALPAGSWVIQVGSFTQQLNASGLRDRLKKTGYKSYLQETGSGSGQAWRVLVGPFDTRVTAEKQRDRITSQHHMKGIVTQLKD